MTNADAFAEEAAAFERWARAGIGHVASAAREALIRLTRLYLAALTLPPASSDDLDAEDRKLVADDEWKAVLQAAGNLPLDNYSLLFDPLPVPPEEPVVGSIADDIADIYRDVVTGLRHDQSGRRSEALWHWAFTLRSHWGAHATSAIRALHCWLAQEAPNHLAQT